MYILCSKNDKIVTEIHRYLKSLRTKKIWKSSTCGLLKKIKITIFFNTIIWKPQNLNFKHNWIIGKHKKDTIVTLSFAKFVSFCHFSVLEELRISEIFFAILLTKILIDNRKGAFFYLYHKQKKIKK